MIDKKIFEEAADIKEQISILNDRYDELKPKLTSMLIEAELEDEGLEIAGRGIFKIGHRRTWTYPSVIKLAEQSVNEAKKEAERTGEAEYVESTFPTYTVNK